MSFGVLGTTIACGSQWYSFRIRDAAHFLGVIYRHYVVTYQPQRVSRRRLESIAAR